MNNRHKDGEHMNRDADQKDRGNELPKQQHEDTRRQQESGQPGGHRNQQGGGARGKDQQQQGGQGGSPHQHQQDQGQRPQGEDKRSGRAAMTDVDSDSDKRGHDQSDEDRKQGRQSIERD